jgi:hypothetical protein
MEFIFSALSEFRSSSNRRPTGHATGHLKQVGLHIDDRVLRGLVLGKKFFRRFAWNRTGQSMKRFWSARV